MQLLCLEVGDASRCSILEHARVVDHILHLAPLALDILLEVRVVGDHLANWLATEHAIVLVHRDVVVGDSASIPRHLQLLVNLVHDQLQPGEKLLVYQVLLKLLDHVLPKLPVSRWSVSL